MKISSSSRVLSWSNKFSILDGHGPYNLIKPFFFFFSFLNLKFHSTKQIKSFSSEYTKQIQRVTTTNISTLLLTKLTNLGKAWDTAFLKYCCGIIMIVLFGWTWCYTNGISLG